MLLWQEMHLMLCSHWDAKVRHCHEVNTFCHQSKVKTSPTVLSGYDYTCSVFCGVKLYYFMYLFSSSHSYSNMENWIKYWWFSGNNIMFYLYSNWGIAQVTWRTHYMYLFPASLLFSSSTSGTPSASLNCEDIQKLFSGTIKHY